jgi:histidinol-phosphate/aromatic aminotransferase/cobyric acid decarboxylase-like protein
MQVSFLKPCWIAHVLELNGLRPRAASNRISRISRNERKYPCPPDKRPAIESAMRKLDRIPRPKREDTNQTAHRVLQEVIRKSES